MAQKATELSILMTARNEAAKVFKQLKGQLKDVNTWVQKNRESLVSMGRAFLVAGAIGAVFLGGAIAKAAEFEQSIANVKAISNATAEEQRLLSDAALEMGTVTSKSASEAAQAELFLAQAGLTAKQNIEALGGVINLAEAAGADLAFTTQLVVATLFQFNLVASESGRVANVFAAATGKSLANLEKLANSLRQVGPIASSLGLSLEETVAILNKLFDAGLRGEQAGTALRAIMLALTAPAGEAAKVIGDLGVEVKDAAGKMRPLVKILDELGKAGATTEQAVKIFGREAVAAFEKLKGTGSIIEAMTDAITDTDEASRQAKDRLDTFIGSVTLLSSSLEVLNITSISPLLSVLALLVDGINQGVQILIAMPLPIKVVIVLLGALTTSILVTVGAMALFAPGVATMITSLRALTVSLGVTTAAVASTGSAFVFGAGKAAIFTRAITLVGGALRFLFLTPWGLIILGIAAATVGAVTVYNRWFKSVEKSTEAIKNNQDALKDTSTDLNELNKKVKQNSQLLKEQEEAAKKLAAAYGKLGIKNVKKETQELNLAYQTIKESGTASARETSAAYDSLRKKLKELKPVQADFEGSFLKAIQSQVSALRKKRDIIQQTFQLEIQALQGVRAAIDDNFDAQEKLLQNIKTIGDEIRQSQAAFGDFEFGLSLKGLDDDQIIQKELQRAQQELRAIQNLAADERLARLQQVLDWTQRLAREAIKGSTTEVIAIQAAKRAQSELIAIQKQKQKELRAEQDQLDQTNAQLQIVQQTLREMLEPLNQIDEKLKNLKAVIDTTSFDLALLDAKRLRLEFESTFARPITQIILVSLRQAAALGIGPAVTTPVPVPVTDGSGPLEDAFLVTKIGGGFAHGLPRVPRDMIVQVHKDEAILTRSEAESRRRGNGGGRTFRDINIFMPAGVKEITREVVREYIIPELERVENLKG